MLNFKVKEKKRNKRMQKQHMLDLHKPAKVSFLYTSQNFVGYDRRWYQAFVWFLFLYTKLVADLRSVGDCRRASWCCFFFFYRVFMCTFGFDPRRCQSWYLDSIWCGSCTGCVRSSALLAYDRLHDYANVHICTVNDVHVCLCVSLCK